MTGWLTNWLNDALGLARHSNTWGTQGTWALEGHLGTRALKALGHLASQALGTRALKRHLAWTLQHSDTPAFGHSRHFI